MWCKIKQQLESNLESIGFCATLESIRQQLESSQKKFRINWIFSQL